MEQIQFNEEYYKKVKRYLNKNYKNGKESKMFGLIYTNNERKLLFLQKRGNPADSYGLVLFKEDHPDFNKLKTDLEGLTKKN